MTANGYGRDGKRATTVVGLVGNPRPESRTHHMTRVLTREVARVVPGAATAEVDLAPLGHRVLDPADEAASAALAMVRRADILVVASPTYKAAYSGLLKGFLDRLDYRPLVGTVAVPVLLARLPQHQFAVDVIFTALMCELGAQVPAGGIFVLEPDLDGFEEFAAGWADTHGPTLLAASRATVGPLLTT